MSFSVFFCQSVPSEALEVFQKFIVLEVELLKFLYNTKMITNEGYSRTLHMKSYMFIGAHLESRLGQ